MTLSITSNVHAASALHDGFDSTHLHIVEIDGHGHHEHDHHDSDNSDSQNDSDHLHFSLVLALLHSEIISPKMMSNNILNTHSSFDSQSYSPPVPPPNS